MTKLDFPFDCVQIQKSFQQKGYEIDLVQAQEIWREYSKEQSSPWVDLPKKRKIIFRLAEHLLPAGIVREEVIPKVIQVKTANRKTTVTRSVVKESVNRQNDGITA